MSLTIYDILAKNVKKMASSLGRNERGNLYPLIMGEVERSLIKLVLEETKNNHLRASKILGISRSTLYRRIKVLEVEKD